MAFKPVNNIDVIYDTEGYGQIIDPTRWNDNFKKIEDGGNANAGNLNDNFTLLGSATDGDSGADNIGATPLTGGVADTVQGILEELNAETEASALLDKIKTVDGAGSGLDADLVDGMNASSPSALNTVVSRDSNQGFGAGYVDMANIGATGGERRLKWNDTYGTLDIGMKGGLVTLQVGQETLLYATNLTGSQINDVTAVIIDGSSGVIPKIRPASNNSGGEFSNVIGVTTQNITNGASGYVCIYGMIHGIDTNNFNEGDKLWLSSTTGLITNIEPTLPHYKVFVGWCVKKAGAGVGMIFVQPNRTQMADETPLFDVAGKYTATNVESALAEIDDKLNTHKGSADHDGRYYTKTNMQTAGQSQLHWDNITNVPAFADDNWKAPVATASALPASGNADGDLRLVLDTDIVYTYDGTTSAWKTIGASGNGISDHAQLTNLLTDVHTQYLKTDGSRVLTGSMLCGQQQLQNAVFHKGTVFPTSPTEGQPFYDTTSNKLFVYKGATLGWTDISGRGALIRALEIVATAGQTVFNLSSVGSFEVGTNAINVYKKNASNRYELIDKDDYTESSSTTITLDVGATVGEVYYFKWFENSPEVINTAVQKDGTLQTNLNSDMLDSKHYSDIELLVSNSVVDVQNNFTTTVPGDALDAVKGKELYDSLLAKADINTTTVLQTASFTLALANIGTVQKCLSGSQIDITIPLNATVNFPINTEIVAARYGAGEVVFVPTGGVSLYSSGSKTKIANQYEAATLKQIATNEWLLIGGLKA